MLVTVALGEAAAAVGLAVLATAVLQEIQDHLAIAAETETTQTVLAALADHLVKRWRSRKVYPWYIQCHIDAEWYSKAVRHNGVERYMTRARDFADVIRVSLIYQLGR